MGQSLGCHGDTAGAASSGLAERVNAALAPRGGHGAAVFADSSDLGLLTAQKQASVVSGAGRLDRLVTRDGVELLAQAIAGRSEHGSTSCTASGVLGLTSPTKQNRCAS